VKAREVGLRALAHALTWAVAATMVLPFAWMVATSLKTDAQVLQGTISFLPPGSPGAWRWENYADAWRHAQLGDFFVNSLVVSIAVTALSLTHNALAGFAFSVLRFRGREPAFWAIMGTMMLPAQVSFIFAYLICAWLGYVDNLYALIVPGMASAFGIFYMRQAIEGVPRSLLDAGRIDGFTDFELFWYVVRPHITSAVAALGIFTFTPAGAPT